MTYKELLSQLQSLSEDQLNEDVCVYDIRSEDYYNCYVELVYAGQECDFLNLDHPIIRF